MTILLIAEHDNKSLKGSTASLVSAAQKLTGAIDILVAGNNCEGVAQEAKKLAGVRTVYLAQSAQLAQESPEALAKQVEELAADYSHIFFGMGSVAKSAMPRLAAQLDISPLSGVLEIKAEKTYVRGIYAGTLLEEVEVLENKVIASIQTAAFEAVEGEGNAELEEVLAVPPVEGTHFISFQEPQSDRPELASAKRVVAGGRGLQDQAGFSVLEGLADKLGAAIGGTRTVVDMGLCPNEAQIGQTGKTIAPDLYIGVGISGAIQHLAGIKNAKVIVAIDTDEDAPIFSVADYHLVADGVETIKALTEAL